MDSGARKITVAVFLIFASILLDLTSSYSSFQIGQLVLSFSFAIAGALVGFRGLMEFLSNRF